jgi:hypothetical protein
VCHHEYTAEPLTSGANHYGYEQIGDLEIRLPEPGPTNKSIGCIRILVSTPKNRTHTTAHGCGFIVHLTLQLPTFLYYINIYGTRSSFELPNRKMLNSKILAIFQVHSWHMLARDEENYQNLINRNRVCYHCGEAWRYRYK